MFTAADLNPDVCESWYTMSGPDIPDVARPPLAEDEVRFVGDPVALVVADSRYIAEDAAELVEVDYDPLLAVPDYVAGATAAMIWCTTDIPATSRWRSVARRRRTVEEVFAGAAHVVEETIYQQSHTAVPLETRGIVVEWAAASGELTIWAATQAPHEVRAFCARLLGLPEQRIRVVMRDTGGGFGQKVVPQREEMCLMLAARKVPAALKWIEDRRENLMAGGHARTSTARRGWPSTTTARCSPPTSTTCRTSARTRRRHPMTAAFAVGLLFPGPYRIPQASWSAKLIYSNTCGRTAYRGPWQFESVAREMLLDIAARRMGIDPVELRRRNLLRQDEMPYAERERHAVRPHDAGRDLRARARDPRLRRRSGASRPRPVRRAATSASARARTSSRRRARSRTSRRRARRSASSRRARSTCTSPAGRRATASRPRSCSSPPTRSGVDIDGRRDHPGRHRGHAVRRGHRRQPERLDDRRRGR